MRIGILLSSQEAVLRFYIVDKSVSEQKLSKTVCCTTIGNYQRNVLACECVSA
ncbi:hypothetical protein COCSUDRAFT_33539 [Coccomyxa subellipsoidea C-169]|uniref:Uncharacterized protein n=1 Tax=Coccomyxa subellipsoidea (strain C-169) TaxID=574566 RepID=I0YTL2_COCSC|nr:hypothetical protein COCSUDRAFT_33539 [Coccomyxa subellipsoidea C-169]EIE21731.1 hypothetical protein COCSUDRAFT_33539 [Coccomyxa subellipsoidea C-169]|eukprot:XP_005646275.1 hypothetical protein COCSUDRAFT_33539 [Coccomyxa subellipsoidea C-169]